MRATISAGTTPIPGCNTRTAHSVLANLSCRAAVCASVTGAKALAVPEAADRGGRRTGALEAKPFVVGSITGAFACPWRIGAKHLLTPLGAIPISTENAANSAQPKKATDGGGDDGSQRVPSRRSAGQVLSSARQILSAAISRLLFRSEIAKKEQNTSSFFFHNFR